MNGNAAPAGQRSLSLQEAIDVGLGHHNAGDLARAENVYRQILKIEPNQPVVLHLLGVVAHQMNDNASAVDLISKAISFQPDFAEAHSNLGLVLEQLDRPKDAIDSYRKAIKINPRYADAHCNLGNALTSLGRRNEAVASYNKALGIDPQLVEAHCNLGNVYRDLGKPADAVNSYNAALAIEPNFAGAHFGLGNAYGDLGQPAEAVACFKKALAIEPNYREARSNYEYIIAKTVEKQIYDLCHAEEDFLPAADRLESSGKEVDALKVNLLFCPFVNPVSPPLGISILKSFLEKNGNSDVQCIDLNLEWHEKISNEDASQYQALAEVLRNGKALFKDLKGEFFNVDQYRKISGDMVDEMYASTYDAQFSLCREDTKDDILSFLKPRALKGDPDVVGFSVLFFEQMLCSLALAKEIKKERPDTIIVFGGAGLLSSGKDAIHSPYVDFVVWDVGEAPFNQLLNFVKKGRFSETIPGLEYKKAGACKKNPPVPSNLNHAAYADFSDLDLDAYYTSNVCVPLLSSKGCYWARCTFCEEAMVNLYVEAEIKRVVDEIEFHRSKGIKYFQFIDEMIPSGRLRELSKEVIRRDLEVYFYANLRPTADFDQETLDLMFQAGFRYVIWGIESCNRRVLKLVKKGTSVKSIRNTLEYATNAGIRNHVFMFFGFPSETPDELFDTMEFLYENRRNIHQVHSGAYVLCEETEIFRHPEKFDIDVACTGTNPPTYEAVHKDGTVGKKAEAYANYFQSTFLNKFSLSHSFGHLRDHALLFYANMPLSEHQKIRPDVPPPVLPSHL